MKIEIITFVSFVSFTKAARILGVFPMAAKSHFICTNAVMKSLADADHKVTVITPFPEDAAKENFTEIIDSSQGEHILVSQIDPKSFSKKTTYDTFELFKGMNLPQCEKVYNLKQIKAILNSSEKQYDVLFVEISFFNQCYYWIGKKLDIPVIGVVTFRSWILADWEMSNTRHPVVIPNEFGISAKYETFSQRIYQMWKTLEFLYYREFYAKQEHFEFYQNHIAKETSFENFMNTKPSLAFVNGHSSYFPRSQNPNMIEIGGIHVKDNRSLSKDFEKFLNEAEHGAVLFTFGSIIRASKVPTHITRAFQQAFAEIPQRVIWKYEEKLENVSSNVMISNWLPQNDILAHKNIIAFITHCGQGAIHESLYHGIPLISCPLFGDQHVNAGIFENLEIAIHLDYDAITKYSVLCALNEIINNTKYYENMKRRSQAFKDRPMTPEQTVVYWTEYAIRNKGAPYFTTPTTQLNWFQYFLLDIICFAVIILLMTLLYISCSIIKLINLISKSYNFITTKNKAE